jgi:hypothetical protein
MNNEFCQTFSRQVLIWYGSSPSQWPDMQYGDVTVAHDLLVDEVERDLFEREGAFD